VLGGASEQRSRRFEPGERGLPFAADVRAQLGEPVRGHHDVRVVVESLEKHEAPMPPAPICRSTK